MAYPEATVDASWDAELGDTAEFEAMENWAELPEETPPEDDESPNFGVMAAGGLAAAGLAAAGMAAMAGDDGEEPELLGAEADFEIDEPLDAEELSDFGDSDFGDSDFGDSESLGAEADLEFDEPLDTGELSDLGDSEPLEPEADLGFDEPLDAGELSDFGDGEPLGSEADLGFNEPPTTDDLASAEPAAVDDTWAEEVISENLELMEEDFAPIDWNEEDLAALDNEDGAGVFADNVTNGFHQDNGPIAEPADAADDFIHKFAPVSPEEVEQRTPGKAQASGSSLKIILGIGVAALALLLAVFGIITLLGRMRQPDVPVPQPPVEIPAEPDDSVEPPTEPDDAVESPTEPDQPTEPPVSDNPFRDAVNAATQASQLAQTATTKEDWQAVADGWEEAITLMQQVPDTDPNYETAQDRAVAYQPNLTYAQQNVQRFP
jgi:hypothetical protein